MPTPSLLVIEPDHKTSVFIHHMLTQAGYEVQVVPTGKEGLIEAWRDPPDIIVTELDLPDIDYIELIHKFRKDQRTSRVILIGFTHLSAPQTTVAGIDAGLDHIIIKQTDAVEVLINYLVKEQKTDATEKSTSLAPHLAHVIAFLGAKGGVGTSSICVNIAHLLSQAVGPGKTVVLDLVLPIGSLCEITGVMGPPDVVDLTELEPSQLTHEYLRENLLTPQAWDFKFIPGASSPDQAERLNADRLAPLLQSLRSTYEYIIVDLGRNLSPLAQLVMSVAEKLVLVLIPDEECVANAHAIVDYLDNHGIQTDRLQYLSNRPLPSEGLTQGTLADRMGVEILAAVPNIGTQLTLLNSLHAPLQLRFPEEQANLILKDTASRLLM
jgi:Flp pilus assembly CpaE family ATPase